MDQAARGSTALAAGRYDEAVQEYTAAIAYNPKSASYHIKRSTAYQRTSPPKFEEALEDAEQATLLALDRASRELIAEAQLRRAIVLFSLERYGDAGFVFSIVKKLNEKEKTLMIWENKVQMKLKGLAEGDAKAVVTVSEKPAPRRTKQVEGKVQPQGTNTSFANAIPKPVEQTPPSKIKHDWYQNNEKVYFTLLAKGVPKDSAVIDIQSQSLSITFPTVSESTYEYSLDPLFATVDPTASTYNITATKIEITLKKQQSDVKWSGLEGTEASKTATTTGSVDTAMRQAVLAADKPPAYPTSSRSGPKNWDKVVDDMAAKSKAKKATDEDGRAKAEKKTTDGDDSDGEVDYADLDAEDGGDPAGAFFKKLYAGADPDTQRAMMKSYSESNGTVLSTNWSEVGKGKVDTQAPDGMEARKWGQ